MADKRRIANLLEELKVEVKRQSEHDAATATQTATQLRHLRREFEGPAASLGKIRVEVHPPAAVNPCIDADLISPL